MPGIGDAGYIGGHACRIEKKDKVIVTLNDGCHRGLSEERCGEWDEKLIQEDWIYSFVRESFANQGWENAMVYMAKNIKGYKHPCRIVQCENQDFQSSLRGVTDIRFFLLGRTELYA